MTLRRFAIELEIPEDATIEAVEAYIVHAVCTECFHRSFEDPMFWLNRESVRITTSWSPPK